MYDMTNFTPKNKTHKQFSELAYIAMNRFTYGADKRTYEHLSTLGSLQQLQNWLKSQIRPYKPDRNTWSSYQAIEGYYRYKLEEKSVQKKMANSMLTEDAATATVKNARKDMISSARELAEQTALSSINSELPLQSRLLDFFSNHFSVSRANMPMTLLAPTLEVEAIAPHLSGNFADMLIAVSQHPAMIFYLNNEKSTGPSSPVGIRQRKKKRDNPRGLNENLAREILELHTLGVDGPYSQNDVIEFAKAITGWSIGSIKRNEAPEFLFRKQAHEQGTRLVLGKKYVASGVSQGIQILRDLASHPSTAHYVSFKLAKHFIADTPPTELVDAMKSTWLKTKGNIAKVLETMIEHDSSWQQAQQKLKTPRELVISSCRACGIEKPRPSLFQTLEILGHGLFNAGSPAGYPDEEAAWLGASALNTRIEWANHFASIVTSKGKKGDPSKLASLALGPFLSANTLQHIVRAESKQQALALLLMSPEFQRR